MNTADIEAARRLIAQFEGNALGRHNSGQFRENPVAEKPAPIPEQRREVTLKTRPEDCAVGDYCWSMGRYTPNVCNIVRFLPPPDPNRFIDFNDIPPMDDAVVTWEFERVWLVLHGPSGPNNREAWHRIA